jgi:hypothetical protein
MKKQTKETESKQLSPEKKRILEMQKLFNKLLG